MQQAGVKPDIQQIVDLGCSTGLSTLELNRAFPQAQITAVELSPYFLAVARFAQRQRQVCGSVLGTLHLNKAKAAQRCVRSYARTASVTFLVLLSITSC